MAKDEEVEWRRMRRLNTQNKYNRGKQSIEWEIIDTFRFYLLQYIQSIPRQRYIRNLPVYIQLDMPKWFTHLFFFCLSVG